MSKTMTVRGREYTVSSVEGAKESRYRLTGKRGASYFTMRNAHRPEMMFVVAHSIGSQVMDGVWLSDADGELRIVSQ